MDMVSQIFEKRCGVLQGRETRKKMETCHACCAIELAPFALSLVVSISLNIADSDSELLSCRFPSTWDLIPRVTTSSNTIALVHSVTSTETECTTQRPV